MIAVPHARDGAKSTAADWTSLPLHVPEMLVASSLHAAEQERAGDLMRHDLDVALHSCQLGVRGARGHEHPVEAAIGIAQSEFVCDSLAFDSARRESTR
jgi:hypothetical protein